jgi:hypothetical protein
VSAPQQLAPLLASAPRDRDGWPIVPTARVRIEYPIRWRDDSGNEHAMTRHGEVVRTETDARGREVVTVREYETRHQLTVLAPWCRVMRGETRVSRRDAVIHHGRRTR